LETAALQERRAEEAAARRKAEKAAGPTRGAIPDRSDSSDRRPPLPLVGAKARWREKEVLRTADDVPATTRTASPMQRASPMERTDSNERPSERPSGPPRLALAGSKPNWRDREIAKAASGGGDAAPTLGPTSRVPSTGGAPLTRGRSGRGEDGRDGSPAPTSTAGDTLKPSGMAGKYVPRHLRDKA
jgi:translation initiation factor 3 subunit A